MKKTAASLFAGPARSLALALSPYTGTFVGTSVPAKQAEAPAKRGAESEALVLSFLRSGGGL